MAFDRPSLRELISQMQADAEREAGATQLRQSNLRVLPKVFAFAVHGLYAYIDWVIPQTDVQVRMGLQPYALPGFVAASPILGNPVDGAGITVSAQFTENVGATLFWMRAENTDDLNHDALDILGLTVPVTFDDRNTSYPQFYAKYALFDNVSYMEAFEAAGIPYTSGSSVYTVDRGYTTEDGDEGWVRCIDFSPFIDPDTVDKYLFWSQSPGAFGGV